MSPDRSYRSETTPESRSPNDDTDSGRSSGHPRTDRSLPGPAQPVLPPELVAVASELFGERLPLAEAYAAALASDGVLRGLIGPREAPRLWDRHLLNCAVVADLIPVGSSVIDVGSGAGLPGIVLAVARPDLTVVLVEPLARRTVFLSEMVERLGLAQSTTVIRGRAEECTDLFSSADIVTARAVAPLDRLATWCLPLARLGGRVLAVKGTSAVDEVSTHGDAVLRLGGGRPVVRLCRRDGLVPPTTVVEIVREAGTAEPGRSKSTRPVRARSTSGGARNTASPDARNRDTRSDSA